MKPEHYRRFRRAILREDSMSEATEVIEGEVVDEDTGELLPVRTTGGGFDLAQVEDPTRAIRVAEELVSTMAEKCNGPQYVAQIAGKKYPKVEWWTTVGAALGLFPREESNKRLDRRDELAYEATVAVYRGQELVTRASAVCSSSEPRWKTADEYAVRSMAATRATGKAYRLGLSFLAVMSGLEATPAEEIPEGGFTDDASDYSCPDCGGPMWDNREDKEAGKRSAKFPDFKCQSRECDNAIWGNHPDDESPDLDALAEEVKKTLDDAAILNAITPDQAARVEEAIEEKSEEHLRTSLNWLKQKMEVAKLEAKKNAGEVAEDEPEEQTAAF